MKLPIEDVLDAHKSTVLDSLAPAMRTNRFLAERIVKHIRARALKSIEILDIGCVTGNLESDLSLIQQIKSIIAVNSNKCLTNIAKGRYRTSQIYQVGCQFIDLDRAEALLNPGASYDVILYRTADRDIQSDLDMQDVLYRGLLPYLKPEGLLILTFPRQPAVLRLLLAHRRHFGFWPALAAGLRIASITLALRLLGRKPTRGWKPSDDFLRKLHPRADIKKIGDSIVMIIGNNQHLRLENF